MISRATGRAISSPASAAGPMQDASLASPTTSPCGPAPVPVSRFRARDSAKAMPTNDTSGPLFTHSSPSAALQRSLENKLRARMDVNGSPEYALTWKTWDMPSGPPICRLRARARRKSDNAFGGWATPRSVESGHTTGNPDRALNHKSRLEDQVYLAGWPAPMAGTPAQKGNNAAGNNDSSRKTTELVAGWKTPAATDGERGGTGITEKMTGGSLTQQVKLAGWAASSSRDCKHANAKPYAERGGGRKGEQLCNQVVHLTSGPTSTSSPAQTEKRGALSPEHSRWIMGFGPEWASCAPTAMPSSRKSRQSS